MIPGPSAAAPRQGQGTFALTPRLRPQIFLRKLLSKKQNQLLLMREGFYG